MPVLVPMRREIFGAFAAEANQAYAQDNVLTGRWAAQEASAKSTAEFEQLVPQGIDTPDHYFYEVHDDAARSVGCVWFAVVGTGQARAGYVFNIRIRPDRQGQGHGRAALLALDAIAMSMNLPAIRLNVFGHNPRAQALYRSLGYEVISSTMRKPLRP